MFAPRRVPVSMARPPRYGGASSASLPPGKDHPLFGTIDPVRPTGPQAPMGPQSPGAPMDGLAGKFNGLNPEMVNMMTAALGQGSGVPSGGMGGPLAPPATPTPTPTTAPSATGVPDWVKTRGVNVDLPTPPLPLSQRPKPKQKKEKAGIFDQLGAAGMAPLIPLHHYWMEEEEPGSSPLAGMIMGKLG